MPVKRGHQPRGLLVTDPGKFVVTLSAPTAVQGATVTVSAQFATSTGSPVAQAGIEVQWGKTGTGGSFNNATSTTNSVGVAVVQFTVGSVIGATYTIGAVATNGRTGNSPVLTVVADPVPASVSVTPTSVTLAVGATQQLAALVKNAQGATLTGQTVTWASLAPAIATVSSSGLVTAVAVGAASIQARCNGIDSNAAAITVTAVAVQVPNSIVIAPATLPIASGAAQLAALIKNAAGAVIPGLAPSAWQSSNPAVATVSATGVVAYVSDGTANITATLLGLTSNPCAVTAAAVVAGGGGGDEVIDGLLVRTVQLPQILLATALTDTPATGATISVTTGAEFQAALDSCHPGDTIAIAAAAILTGNFIMTPRSGGHAGEWVIIKSTGSAGAEGQRMTPTNAATYNTPRLVAAIAGPTLKFSSGVSKVRCIGLDVGIDSAVPYTPSSLIDVGLGGETSMADLPTDIIFDRCYIHGNDATQVHRALGFNGNRLALVDSWVSNVHFAGIDSQAIFSYNGAGPFKIVNNFLEASTEVITLGGADPPVVGLIPQDIEIRRNHITKRLAWEADPANNLEKNLVEFKKGKRILVEANVLENAWVGAQYGWAFVAWTVNQQGTDLTAETAHITFRRNDIRNVASGFQLNGGANFGTGNPQPGGFVPMHHVAIYNNVLRGTGNASVNPGGGTPMFILGNAISDLSIEHNTAMLPTNGGAWLELVTFGDICRNIRLRNNLGAGGQYPFVISFPVTPSWSAITAATGDFQGNVVACANARDGAQQYGFPLEPTNAYPPDPSTLGFAGGSDAGTSPTATMADVVLAPGTWYKGKGTDGADPGANVASVVAYTAGVVIP